MKNIMLLFTLLFSSLSFAEITCIGSGDDLYLFTAQVDDTQVETITDYKLELDGFVSGNPVAVGESSSYDEDYRPTSKYKNFNRFWLSTEIDGQYRILLPKKLTAKFEAVLRLNYGPENDFYQFKLSCEND